MFKLLTKIRYHIITTLQLLKWYKARISHHSTHKQEGILHHQHQAYNQLPLGAEIFSETIYQFVHTSYITTKYYVKKQNIDKKVN
jgi:hypothetical protein